MIHLCMPKFIRSTKSIIQQADEIEQTYTYFHHVPQSNMKRDNDLAYSVLYMEAKRFVGNPSDLVKIARQIPDLWNPALSVVQARQNKDKIQSKAMLTLIKQRLNELVNHYKQRERKNHFANLQAEPEPKKTPEEIAYEEHCQFTYRRAKIEARNHKEKNPWD